LTTPEAAILAGPGLQEVCETVGMSPDLGFEACVDNSHLFIAASAMVKEGGLGHSIAQLPLVGAAPEWMSEKAICIGQYFVASGVFTVFGVAFSMIEETKSHKLLFEGLEEQGLGKWGFTADPYEIASMMIAHIDKKRKELGFHKARERVLMDMADRREMEAKY
jgi:carbon-monoxide dehydrogenase catalytic subunit